MRRMRAILLATWMLLSLLPLPALGEGETVLRALLVSCDSFVSQVDTSTAAKTNSSLIAQALSSDRRGYAAIREENGTIASVDALRNAVNETFGAADEDDVSVFYISTHGLYNVSQSNQTASLLLSDGTTEEAVSALALEDIFSGIKGTKVLLLDACNAGAFIGKGLSDPADRTLFGGKDYKVLCSAGGSEESWYWQSSTKKTQRGASYFASILSNGLGQAEGYPADVNHDGVITLKETYDYVMTNYAASTPQVYPQQDNTFALLEYDKDAVNEPTDAITSISFEDTVLTGTLSQINFSFTVRKPVTVFYQLVYFQGGTWKFSEAQFIKDEMDGEQMAVGRKKRTLTMALSDEEVDTYGYVMVQIFSQEESGRMSLQGSKLLCVQPLEGDMVLEVRANGAFKPSAGQEMTVRVLHDVPCSLTVSVQNMRGETVRYLQYDLPTRPQHLVPEGSSFYWDGTLSDGSQAPAGSYILRARTNIGGKTYVAYSSPVILLDQEGRAPAEG